MTLRRLTASLGAAVLLVVAACSSSDDTSGETTVGEVDESQEVTLTWWTGQTAEAQELLEGLVKEYETDHPNVTIEASSGASTTDDLLPKLQTGFASDTYPDISYAFGNWATELGVSGRTLDIADLVAEPDSGWDEFPEAATETATVDGKVIGFLPWSTTSA
jgi:multiple sugar transport system substrate-binding protein